MAKVKKVTTVTTITEEIISNEKTHIIAILDTSGSMSSIIKESINAFNGFLKTQRELSDECTITINLFDDKFETIIEDKNVKEISDITDKQWIPRGLTGLYDAIGKSINNAKSGFAKLEDKPAKVLVCIVTDGQENSSKEYNSETIKKLIKNSEEENWNFMYLASGQDAFAVGSQFGMSLGNTYSFMANDVQAFHGAMGQMSASAVNYRSMSSKDLNFKAKSKNLIDDTPDIKTTTNTVTTSGSVDVSGILNVDGNTTITQADVFSTPTKSK